jgi:hypothetical protein
MKDDIGGLGEDGDVERGKGGRIQRGGDEVGWRGRRRGGEGELEKRRR